MVCLSRYEFLFANFDMPSKDEEAEDTDSWRLEAFIGVAVARVVGAGTGTGSEASVGVVFVSAIACVSLGDLSSTCAENFPNGATDESGLSRGDSQLLAFGVGVDRSFCGIAIEGPDTDRRVLECRMESVEGFGGFTSHSFSPRAEGDFL